MRRFLVLLGLLLAAVWLVKHPVLPTLGQGLSGENKLILAFRESKARFEDYTINGWARVNRKFMTFAEMEELAWQAARVFPYREGNLRLDKQEDTGFRSLRLAGKLGEKTELEIWIQSMAGVKTRIGQEETGQEAETYAVITIKELGDLDKLSQDRLTVDAAFKRIASSAKVSEVVAGWLPQLVDQQQGREIVASIFKELDGKKIEGYEEGAVVSWTGYSDELKDNLRLGNRVVNLNVAVRTVPGEQRSYLVIGTPLITTEY
ncbi:YwmB family TATA-box binding protein [Carboxydocella sp. ULO1]|uniref:YwmB family TATA-box binding protein n=1 Tax=Carboxydocella sp. ULO1 TaxID=1926599 RepID=UPI0009ADDD30|nr:YwmB family TATA-box binding protein [Carboxydocella sp. ULO1]GAW29431.1 hypothetical protein ULO1_20010 [Carboxydocella sp. ULO1]